MPGMRPTNECLEAAERPVLHIDLGLVVEQELTVVDGVTQLARQRQPRRRVAILFGGVDGMPAVRLLGDVHGHIGAPQQRGGVTAVSGRKSDPQTGPDVEGVLVDQEGSLQCSNQLLARGLGRLGVADRREENRELVATEPGDRIGHANLFPKPWADLHQQLIADVMAERVVPLLEAIEVHDHQRQRGPHTR